MATEPALDQIRRLYFNATRSTIQNDMAKAIDLLKGMESEAAREKATVFMEGLAQMRSEWAPGGGDGRRGASRKGAAPTSRRAKGGSKSGRR